MNHFVMYMTDQTDVDLTLPWLLFTFYLNFQNLQEYIQLVLVWMSVTKVHVHCTCTEAKPNILMALICSLSTECPVIMS